MASRWWVWELMHDLKVCFGWWWANRPRIWRCPGCGRIYVWYASEKPKKSDRCSPCLRAREARGE